MTNPDLKNALKESLIATIEDKKTAEPGEAELHADDLDLISGGLSDAADKCSAMACGVF